MLVVPNVGGIRPIRGFPAFVLREETREQILTFEISFKLR